MINVKIYLETFNSDFFIYPTEHVSDKLIYLQSLNKNRIIG